MATYGYKIGSTYENQVNVEDLLSSAKLMVPPPRGMSLEPASVYSTALDGHTYGDGFSRCIWEFDFLTDKAFNALMAYIGSSRQSWPVYITTRANTHSYMGTPVYTCYTAIMHRPKVGEDCLWEPGGWKDIRVHFTHMELYVVPPPPAP